MTRYQVDERDGSLYVGDVMISVDGYTLMIAEDTLSAIGCYDWYNVRLGRCHVCGKHFIGHRCSHACSDDCHRRLRADYHRRYRAKRTKPRSPRPFLFTAPTISSVF